jgi:puromycin-sensitive aminopeptidase
VQRTLDFALTQEARSQDAAALIGSLLQAPWASDTAWSFATTRWDMLTAKLETFQGIPRLITSLGTFCSEEKALQVREFFMRHPVPTSERTIQQQIEKVQSCGTLKTRQAPFLSAWIAARGV